MRRPALLACGLVLVLRSTASAQVTQRVSVASNGAQGNGYCWRGTPVSFDGRYVAFASESTNLVPGDSNGVTDVFVRDRQSGTTERVSVDSNRSEADAASGISAISADGRYVVFSSSATNLDPWDTDAAPDVYVRDRQNGTTELVSVDLFGVAGEGLHVSISADGRYVAFSSYGANLVAGDANGSWDVFVRDRQAGTTERVSVDSFGGEANSASGDTGVSISADGRYVAFPSWATNLVAGDTNGFIDAFVHDRQTGTTERVSVDSNGVQGNNITCNFEYPSLSADGRFVVFPSLATNLVPGDTNGWSDIFVRDRQNGTTERVSVAPGGGDADSNTQAPSISADGRYVAFLCHATNLVPGDANNISDIVVHDRQTGTNELASVDSAGVQADLSSDLFPSMSGDGRFVAFGCYATNLVPGDTNFWNDTFLRQLVGGTSFISLCSPGVAGVIACPCSNPPSGLGRGCNNSSATGGAILSASGGTYLSSDSLVLTTSGERATSLSIVAQWIGPSASGVAFGMGVRCTSGTFKRLFSKNAVAGSITVPNFGAGDPTISARSAAKGDTILAGQSRWYVVYYRDPNVLGGCSPLSNFNATQTGQVTWSP